MQPLMLDDLPHVYRPDLSMKVLFALSGSMLLAFGAIFTYLFCKLFAAFFAADAGTLFLNAGVATRVLMLAAVLAGFLAVLLCAAGAITQFLKLAKFAVILSADSIRFQAPFGSTTLPLNQIMGRRNQVTTGRFGDTYTLLIPRDYARRNLAISSDFVFDDVYTQWLASLPDLDGLAGAHTPACQLCEPSAPY